MLYIIDQTVLVPDSCRATVRNGNGISADMIEDTIRNYKNHVFFPALFQTILVFF